MGPREDPTAPDDLRQTVECVKCRAWIKQTELAMARHRRRCPMRPAGEAAQQRLEQDRRAKAKRR